MAGDGTRCSLGADLSGASSNGGDCGFGHRGQAGVNQFERQNPRVYAFHRYFFIALMTLLTLFLIMTAAPPVKDVGAEIMVCIVLVGWMSLLVIVVPRVFNASTIVLKDEGISGIFLYRNGAWIVRKSISWQGIVRAEFARGGFTIWDDGGRWSILPMMFDRPQDATDFVISNLPESVALHIAST